MESGERLEITFLGVPNHPLASARGRSAGLREHRREPEHWWIAAIRRREPCCPVCYRETWAEAAA